MPRYDEHFKKNEAYVYEGRHATAEEEPLLIERAEEMGFDPVNNATHCKVVRYLICNKHRSNPPTFYAAFIDILSVAFSREERQNNFCLRANAVLKKAKYLKPVPADSKEHRRVKKVYEEFMKGFPEKLKWKPAHKVQIAEGLTNLKEIRIYGLSNEDFSAHTENLGTCPYVGTVLNKIIRSKISMILGVGPKTISNLIRKKIDQNGGWDGLFDSTAWFAQRKEAGSFGNVSSLKKMQDTYWASRLKIWVESFMRKYDTYTIEDVYVFSSWPAAGESPENVKGRVRFEEWMKQSARNDGYTHLNHLMRNIMNACDSRLGVAYNVPLTAEDEEMVIRCCKVHGVGTAGFVQASEKTGLPFTKIMNWVTDARLGHSIESLSKLIKEYDLDSPEPHIARLERLDEASDTEDE